MTLIISDLTSAKTLDNLNSSQLKKICGGWGLFSVAITNMTQTTKEQNATADGKGNIVTTNMDGNVNIGM